MGGSSTASSPAGATLQLPINSLWANRKCVLTCVVVSLANMQYGLDTASLAGLQAMPGFLKVFGYPDTRLNGGYGIDPTFQQLIASLLFLGAFLSSVFAGPFAAFFGRRPALWTACFLTALGAAVQIGTTSWGVVYLGRLVIGVGNGWLVIFSNIYCAEAAPAHLRAVLVGLFIQWAMIGTILGAVITWATSKDPGKGSYQIPLAIQFVVPTLLSLGLWWVPESPRWLVNRGNLQEGRRSLERLRGDSLSPEEFELEWVETVKGIQEERKLAGKVTVFDMFKGTNRRRTLLCFGVIIAQPSAGIIFTSYSTYFFVLSGLSVEQAFRYNILKSSMGLVGVQVGLPLMRHVLGRRTMLMSGALVQGLCMLSLGIVASTVEHGSPLSQGLVVTFLSLFLFSFNVFVGAASYPVATEIVSTRLRSWTLGVAVSLNYLVAWLAGFCSPFFINPEGLNWGAKYGYIWAAANFICGIFYFFFVPELKGRTLEEIDELFDREIAAWKFKSTKTMILDEALKEVQEKKSRLGEVRVEITEKI